MYKYTDSLICYSIILEDASHTWMTILVLILVLIVYHAGGPGGAQIIGEEHTTAPPLTCPAGSRPSAGHFPPGLQFLGFRGSASSCEL